METQRKRERQGGSVWKGALCWFGSVKRVTALRAKASLVSNELRVAKEVSLAVAILVP